jgi:hypothetical protein
MKKIKLALVGGLVTVVVGFVAVRIPDDADRVLGLIKAIAVMFVLPPVLFFTYIVGADMYVISGGGQGVAVIYGLVGILPYFGWGAFLAIVGHFFLFETLGLDARLKRRRLKMSNSASEESSWSDFWRRSE